MSSYLDALYDDSGSDYDEDYEEGMTVEEQREAFYAQNYDDDEQEEEEDQVSSLQKFNTNNRATVKQTIQVAPKEKKKEKGSNVIIVVEEASKKKKGIDWDQAYKDLTERSVKQIRFTMRDVEAHKLHYDRLFADYHDKEESDSDDEDSEEEDDDEERKEEKAKKQRKKIQEMFRQNVVRQKAFELDLSRMAGCISGGSIVFLFGGSKNGKLHSQFVAYDQKYNHWIDIKKKFHEKHANDRSVIFPHAMENAVLFTSGDTLILYDCQRTFYVFKNYLGLVRKVPQKSTTILPPIFERYGVEMKKEIKETTNHSHSVIHNTIWIFGGRDVSTKSPVNQLVRCEVVVQRGTGYYHRAETYFMSRDVIIGKGAPVPRQNHAQCSVGINLFVFGGFYISKDQLLNDLHMYDTKRNVWTEIDMTYVPPPMRDHSICACSERYLYLTGGMLADGKISDILYRYDIMSKEFTVVNAGGPSEYVLLGMGETGPKDLQKPRVEHLSIGDTNRVYVLGGISEVSASSRKHCNYSVVLKETLDVGVDNSSYHHLKERFEKQFAGDFEGYDIVLRLAHRQSGESEHIYAHKCVISVRSQYFRDLLASFTPEDFIEDVPVLEINEYHFDTMKIYMRFLYCGDLIITEKSSHILANNEDATTTDCLKDLLQISRVDGDKYKIIAQLCNQQRVYLDSSTAVLNQLKEDFGSMYNTIKETVDAFIPEPCEHNNYADVTIQLLDPHSGDLLHEMRAHKFILCKSNYIDTVFKSGMEESTTGIIKFSEISYNGLMCVLKYLYTNEISVPLETAVEVFICSLLFQLNELANYCRTIVIQNITVENVIDIAIMVDVYQDLALKNNCIKCIVLHHEQLSKTDGFEHLPSDVKSEVNVRYLDQIKKITKMKAKQRIKDLEKRSLRK